MPFIPHTDDEVKAMLSAIGVDSLQHLFDEIPSQLLDTSLTSVPEGINEITLNRLMADRAKQDEVALNFIGAGAYEHHIPSAVWEIAGRGEFMTAYTPYQAEASQGNLQLLYEYQTMIASLCGMEVSNASMYDGATALAEAILMAVRLKRKQNTHRVIIPQNLHPYYRAVVKTIISQQDIALVELPYDQENGRMLKASLQQLEPTETTAIVVPQPNFFGVLEDVDAITQFANEHNILLIALVNPTALALIKEPGSWGERGADIVCGEGQALGIPLASGGPYFGFLCCKQAYVRQLPGRLVGRTVDQFDKPGFALTLQAREQHIRRAKATSNICTNQGLMVVAATIYMSLLGPEGLKRVAQISHSNTLYLSQQLSAIPGVERVFASPFFHECVIRLPCEVQPLLEKLADSGIQGGYDISEHYPELGQCLLVCATETKTKHELDFFCEQMSKALC